jgi:hypothetical protein
MSVTSLAIQIRTPCARSIACKLGSPITSPPPPPSTTPALFRVESSPYHQASPILQSDFNTRIVWQPRRRLRHLHFQEFRRRPFAQPFLPHKEIRPAQTTLTAECRHGLPATRLLANQPSPLRPCLLRAFGHVATLRCDGVFHKMGFV